MASLRSITGTVPLLIETASGEIADRLGGNKCVAIPLPPAVPVPDPMPEGVTVAQCKY